MVHLHHLLGGHGRNGHQQQSVDLSHGAVDAPLGAQGAPALDEFRFGFVNLHAIKVYAKSELSIFTEMFFYFPDLNR